ncbi:hypothetical protein EK21DRAFT_112745 [Setomelanomma holmii]|uniref:Uncharacterized protein n=1 Tax=Setomelanomma holmii TaxID=210430 RepID=A0A9P4H8C7_9PLEO|nr:hypothetical protein EK21DRAFT_112745 [Setomelanomma holmii]
MIKEPENGAVFDRVKEPLKEELTNKLVKGSKGRPRGRPRKENAPQPPTLGLSQNGAPPDNGERRDSANNATGTTELPTIDERAEPGTQCFKRRKHRPSSSIAGTSGLEYSLMDALPSGSYRKKMVDVAQRILDKLPEEAHGPYGHFVGVARPKAAHEAGKRPRFNADLQTFVLRHDIIGLHNELATWGSKSGWRKAGQLPVFESNDSTTS